MSTNSTLEALPPPAKPKVTPFVALIILAALICAFTALRGEAPVTTDSPADWISWVRIEKMWGGIFACGVALLVIGILGVVLRLLPRRGAKALKPSPQAAPRAAAPAPSPVVTAPAAADVVVPAAALADYVPEDRSVARREDHLHVPTANTLSETVVAMPQRSEPRGSLKFDAQRLGATSSPDAPAAMTQAREAEEAVTAPLFSDVPVSEMPSLEPAIFHDNASDSFLSQTPAAPATPSGFDAAGFDPRAVLSEAHGLHVVRDEPEGAKIIPIRPDVTLAAPTARDPLEAALLAEPTASPPPAPQSDINAVISSAMRFIDAPTAETPVAETPLAESAVAAPVDGDAEIRQAVQTALSVWPDTTRSIAADELSVRVAHLYYDGDSHSHQIFQLIASGDLGAAATALQVHADALAHDGRTSEAAELWRVYGALNMGRDDSRAMTAYAKVSELDPSDANIHLYLTRRYQMAGDTAKLLPVIGRALAVISDPAVRTELLTPYADLQMKAGDVQAAGDALEELSRLHETTTYLRPDDIGARSSYAISLARLAQAREMHGAFDKAGPLYKKAYQVFADLSALKPEHVGLKAMADNALKDAKRFGV